MRIRVLPESLRDLAIQCQRAAQELTDLEAFLRSAWMGLDWEIRQNLDMEQQALRVRRQALALAEEANALSRFLLNRVSAFEQADREGTSLLAGNTARWHAIFAPLATSPPLLAAQIQRRQALGSWMAPLPLNVFRLEAQEWGVLTKFAIKEVLKRIRLGVLNDLLDAVKLPHWIHQLEQALQVWEQISQRSGRSSPSAQEAFGRFIEILIFEMPVMGTKAKTFYVILKALGRLRPVE